MINFNTGHYGASNINLGNQQGNPPPLTHKAATDLYAERRIQESHDQAVAYVRANGAPENWMAPIANDYPGQQLTTQQQPPFHPHTLAAAAHRHPNIREYITNQNAPSGSNNVNDKRTFREKEKQLVQDPEKPGKMITAGTLRKRNNDRELVQDPQNHGKMITLGALRKRNSDRKLVQDPENPGEMTKAGTLRNRKYKRKTVQDPENPGEMTTYSVLYNRTYRRKFNDSLE